MKKIVGICMTLVSCTTYGQTISKNQPITFPLDIQGLASSNENFRQVIANGAHSQLVVMSLKPQEDIGMETHDGDQTIVIVQGSGNSFVDGKQATISEGDLLFIPAGKRHNIMNTGKKPLKLYTLYAPAEFKPGTVEKAKPR